MDVRGPRLSPLEMGKPESTSTRSLVLRHVGIDGRSDGVLVCNHSLRHLGVLCVSAVNARGKTSLPRRRELKPGHHINSNVTDC
jgi:hypothetical protein